MAYTQSMIYYKSGGSGRASSLAVALSTASLFFVGPHIASYMPRCMAGTLLLHCGIDLFSEGCYDSYGKYDCELVACMIKYSNANNSNIAFQFAFK